MFPERPKYLLSGLVRCGCCGGGFAIRRNDRFSCATFANRGTCRNHLRIGRGALEAKVLSALRDQLTAEPERCIAFCEVYARRLRDLRNERNTLIQTCLDELGRVEAEYDRLTDVSRRRNRFETETELQSMIARHQFITRQLKRARDAAEPFESEYPNYVEGLVDAVRRTYGQYNSYQAFRSAIGQIVLTPTEDKSALLVSFVAGATRPPRGRPARSRKNGAASVVAIGSTDMLPRQRGGNSHTGNHKEKQHFGVAAEGFEPPTKGL